MENLKIYNKLRTVPEEAKKPISGGRTNGMTDVNPMWRIKVMTDAFGMCGIGWRYTITKQWMEAYGNEVKCFTNIDLYVRDPETKEWSDAIPGTGGSTFVEAKGYVNDEGFKMSLTDALSVAMKALGVAADVYFAKDADYGTKYEPLPEEKKKQEVKKAAPVQASTPVPPPPAPAPVPTAAPTPPPPAPVAPQKVKPAEKPAEKTPLENLEEAFNLVKVKISEAKKHSDLTMLFAQKGNLQNYQPFRDALNARWDEIENSEKLKKMEGVKS